MKRFLSLTLALIGILFLSGCQQDLKQVSGTYTYKTSGTVAISEGTSHTTLAINDEIGQLDITPLHKSDSLLLLFNQMTGSAMHTTATLNSKELHLQPYTRTLSLTYTPNSQTGNDLIGSNKQTETFLIEVTGSGVVYDESILFVCEWTGKALNSNKTISGSNLQTIAQRND
ncbi:MAG: hypothetical protein NC038_02640 [Paludibacter sp.]|nr:hypothetical protein [Bacteroidales bacterium]MCM1068977.1 hypothetical protein [Prevotella sp.]MCM1353640.1 hypothetical protein [Bacteroides sp.]MCM1442011.1 hypothetical protein [Muribaculum sp.]MCM1481533.1 hypothetical protein [Paludibacter sp.]